MQGFKQNHSEFLSPEHLGEESCVVIDVETTGLFPSQHRIIEIAALKFINGREVARLCTLIRPDDSKAVPDEITKITGISTEMLFDAPSFDRVAATVQGMVLGCRVVGHNLPFDLGFIDAELQRYDLPALHDFSEHDTLAYVMDFIVNRDRQFQLSPITVPLISIVS